MPPAFKVSVEKSAVILMDSLLYAIHFLFSLTAFNILSLFSVMDILTIIYHGDILFWSRQFVVLEAPYT
jgi:hypothetical protein